MRRATKCHAARKAKSKVLQKEHSSPKKLKVSEDAETISLLACGSFNPITNMHLRMFEIARGYLKRVKCAHVLRGIISPVSDGYGKQGLECSRHRLRMCSLAIKSNPWLEISTWESEKDAWTPTIDVLRHSLNHLREEKDSSKLMLLCGSDFLESFNRPGLWKELDIKAILDEFGIVVFQRPGIKPEDVVNNNKILLDSKEKIHIVKDSINNDTSSTLLRHAIRSGESIKYLTPDRVVWYITKHKLYAREEDERKNTDEILAPYKVNSTCHASI